MDPHSATSAHGTCASLRFARVHEMAGAGSPPFFGEPNDPVNVISRPQHRAALCALLALCICAAQLGTFLHALSHLQGTLSESAAGPTAFMAPGHDAAADELCLQCLAFARMALAAPGTRFVAPVA
jgi:hypothetical protein